MVKAIAAIIFLFISACSISKSGSFSFPGNAIAPAPTQNSGSGNTIEILNSKTATLSDSTVSPSNIAYDGTRLLWMNTLGTSNCFPSDQATFQYMGLDFSDQVTSTSTYSTIDSGVDCNGSDYPIFGAAAGDSGMFWQTSSGGTSLSVRDDSTGSLVSTISITPSNYGCTTGAPSSGNGPLITYCGDLFYGACTTSTNYLRLFSFDSTGTMQSAVTTTYSELSYDKLNALTCYNDNSLLLVVNSGIPNSIYKYDLSFNQDAQAEFSSNWSNDLDTIVGIATDGSYLYLQGVADDSNSPPTVLFAQTTLGNLK